MYSPSDNVMTGTDNGLRSMDQLEEVEAYMAEDVEQEERELECETINSNLIQEDEEVKDEQILKLILPVDLDRDDLSTGFDHVSDNVTLEQEYKQVPTEDLYERIADEGDCIQYSGVVAVAKHCLETVFTKIAESSCTSRPSSISSHSSNSLVDDSALTFPDNENKFTDWPCIKEFTEQLGIERIKLYCTTWFYEEDWLYTVNFVHAQSDICSDYYIYETIWSIPTKEYPVPQVTASIIFTIVVSRVKPNHCEVDVRLGLYLTQGVFASQMLKGAIERQKTNTQVYYVLEGGSYRFNPRLHQFQESWLFDILDEKLLLFKSLKF